MKIKISKQIQVGAFNYTVKLKAHMIADKHNSGFFDPINETLSIDPHLPPMERKISLIHETLHLIERAFELNLEENDTERLAMGFTCFLNSLDIDFDWSDISES